MSNPMIAGLRTQKQLHGNTFLVGAELLHRLNAQGWGRTSYKMLGWKAHCHERTAKRQVKRLVEDHHLFRKYTFRTPHGNGINLYQYIGPRVHTAFPPRKTHSGGMSPTLPTRGREGEKNTSLRQEIDTLKKGLRFCKSGSDAYASTQEKITYLEALLREYKEMIRGR